MYTVYTQYPWVSPLFNKIAYYLSKKKKKNSGPTMYIEQITHYQIREMQIIAKSFPRV